MEKSSSEESAIHRSPSLDSHDSEFARASAATGGKRFGGRGFTAGAFYGSTGPRAGAATGTTTTTTGTAAGAATGAAGCATSGDGANVGGITTAPLGDKAAAAAENKYKAPKGSKYVVFYLDLSFVFLLEFKKCNMARGCLCCLKYMMFLFNLIFWVSGIPNSSIFCVCLLCVYFFLSFYSLSLSPCCSLWCFLSCCDCVCVCGG